MSFYGEIQDLSGFLPVQSTVGYLLLQGGLTIQFLEVPLNPCDSVIQ